MQSDDLECPGLCRSKPVSGACKLAVADPAGLMAPRAHGVQADHVERGHPIGTVGPTASGAAGLYFELRIDGQAVDPLQWLKKR